MSSPREHLHRPDRDHQARSPVEPARAPSAAAPDLSAAATAVEHVQARGGGQQLVMTDEASRKESAAAGIAEPARALPHLDKIQRSFGNHDLSGVSAHVGGHAAAASEAIGAQGFATGSHVAFAREPDLFLAAHEAAHVVQQREGVHLKGGVGEAGDQHEQNADAVAARVVAGESATDLLPGAGQELKRDPGGSMQLYTEEEIRGQTWRVSESGETALAQDGTLQTLYATIDKIAQANVALGSAGRAGSFIELVDGKDTMKVKGQTLHLVVPQVNPKGTDPGNQILEDANEPGAEDSAGESGDTMALWADCGRSSRAVMGTDGQGAVPRGTYEVDGKEKSTSRSYGPGNYSDQIYVAAMPAFVQDPRSHKYLKEGVHYTGDLEYVWDAIKPTSADHAREQYWELGDEGRLAFDQYAKVNTAADPEIGGAYTMATEYNMPGSDVVRDRRGKAKPRWNFHWGGVIMKDGSNNITLENYAVGFAPTGDAKKDRENQERAYNWVNRNWNYQMYGTVKTGQTFHEQHLETGTHGTRASTFSAKAD